MDLLKLLKEAREKREELSQSIRSAESIEALDKLELELRKVDREIKDLETKIAEEEAAKRSKADETPVGELNPITTFRKAAEPKVENEDEDIFASMEYRKAFKDYVMNGTPIPEEFRAEAKVNDATKMTVVGNVGAVIPTTIMNRVIEDLTVEGKILNRVEQTSYQGGVEIRLADINPTATWLTSEENVSEEQKAEMNATISFSYHVLEAKVAMGLLTATVSLPIFESTVVNQLKKAMIRTIEEAIVRGTGTGQPKGFLTYDADLPAEQKLTFAAKDMGSFASWTRVEEAIPEVYETNGVYLMNKKTWEKYLNGMVDSAGQRIGLAKINEKGQKILNGRQVITTDSLPSFDMAKSGDIFAVVINLNDYMLNSNLSMYYKKYFSEDTNKWVHKSLMIVDGKMKMGKVGNKLVGSKGLLYLKKA